MHLLGRNLPEHKLVRIALTSFFGIGDHTASRILARLSIHESAQISSLTEPQVTALSSFLSSPSTSAVPPATPICPPGVDPRTIDLEAIRNAVFENNKGKSREVPGGALEELKIETDLRRQVQADIGHQRAIGSYRGRRHAFGLPVRGQRTKTNAKTARKLNRIDRKGFATSSILHSELASQPSPAIPHVISTRHAGPVTKALQDLVPTAFAQLSM